MYYNYPRQHHSNTYAKSLALSDNETNYSHSSGYPNSVSTLSSTSTFQYHDTTCPNFDYTEWGISKPDSINKITRYTLKRTVFVYGILDGISKKKIFHIFSQFGSINDIIQVGESHYVLGEPDLEHGRRLTKKYVPDVDPNKTTCFYIIFHTKGGFNKCAHKALNNSSFNIFKMDKRLKDFNLRRMS